MSYQKLTDLDNSGGRLLVKVSKHYHRTATNAVLLHALILNGCLACIVIGGRYNSISDIARREPMLLAALGGGVVDILMSAILLWQLARGEWFEFDRIENSVKRNSKVIAALSTIRSVDVISEQYRTLFKTRRHIDRNYECVSCGPFPTIYLVTDKNRCVRVVGRMFPPRRGPLDWRLDLDGVYPDQLELIALAAQIADYVGVQMRIC
jgi:hypothetical protein